MRQLRPQEPIEHAVHVERVAGFPARTLAGAGVVIALIVIALAKPWGDGQRTIVAQQQPVAAISPSATPGTLPSPAADPAVAAAAIRALCNAPPTWRLVTMESSPLGDTRTMYGIEPRPAAGPLDPSMPTADVAAFSLAAIGVCRPLTAGRADMRQPANGIEVAIWRIDPAGDAAPAPKVVVDEALYSIGEAYYAPAASEGDPQLAAHIVWRIFTLTARRRVVSSALPIDAPA